MPEDLWSFEIGSDSPHESGLILARPDTQKLFILNHSAAYLWSLRQSLPRGEDLTGPYSSHYGISTQQASADIADTLRSWSSLLLDNLDGDHSGPNVQAVFDLAEPPFVSDFSLGGSFFRLTVSHDAPDFIEEIQPRLAHLVTAPTQSASADCCFRVTRSAQDHSLCVSRCHDSIFVGSAPDAAVARTILLQEVGRLANDRNARWLSILHAAVVAHPVSNDAVILAAPTNSGKSTLAAALLHSGLRLLSDDSAALTTTKKVISLPFALMLREGSWPVLAPLFPELANSPVHERYGEPVRFLKPPSASTQTAQAKHIVFLQYQPDAPQATLLSLSPLQAFYQLQKSGFWVPHTRSAIAAFVEWVLSVPAHHLTYSHLPNAIQQVHNLLGTQA